MDANHKKTKEVYIPSYLERECVLVFLVNCLANRALCVAATAAARPLRTLLEECDPG